MIYRCTECERQVDTDFELGGFVGEEWMCDRCYGRIYEEEQKLDALTEDEYEPGRA